jgi:two-component system response regulator HydG
MRARVLIVDDDAEHCESLAATLTSLKYDATFTTSPHEALERVARETFSLVLTDLGMGEVDGLELCARVLGTRQDIPVIVITGNGSMDAAIQAMRVGAYDFLSKPIDRELLRMSVGRAVQHHQLQAEVKVLREASLDATPLQRLVGTSPAMKRLRDLMARVGGSDISVLIEGETGTGKEIVARALHAAGARRDGPFVAVNCSAVAAPLLESEFFGHVKGSFTGASSARVGLLVQASKGTLLLDEIGDMPLDMQTKLLRAIQEKCVRPVGGGEEVPFDARIIAATNRDLEADVTEKRFREDLFYRIAVVKVDVPPLRAREGDVLRLAAYFLDKFAAKSGRGTMYLSPQFAGALVAYSWPGNVRELENCMERAVTLARLDHLSIEDLPKRVADQRLVSFTASASKPAEILTLEEVDRSYIARALVLLGGNKTRAADMLGLDRRTLYRRLEKYEAEEADEKPSPRHGESEASPS